eukprot:CAMPEP_0177476556 /NCGR_PEP_ID=MMETSP0369-20130122/23646_1 /TAXON_ID=447022 ORGANISM="Scrippsiella hangoei-like, Strain SHHI-4" /NCGR_SAMPLE_ID=MMETSP0369 /ASSEMBLY_ACC=CAM_ASM_000364 /LENGTH=73 /DNA_ID=CAMNT_0018951787 /DNA_START=149 /DNA_END=367 /DNA_ORIENTATION=-
MCAQPQRVGSKTVQVAVQTPAKPTRCHHEWLDQRFNDEEESAKRQCAPPYHKLCLSQENNFANGGARRRSAPS